MIQILEDVRGLVYETTGVEKWQITMDSEIIDDLNIHELDLIEIIMEIEKERKINLEDVNIDKIRTIRCLVEEIHKKMTEKCRIRNKKRTIL